MNHLIKINEERKIKSMMNINDMIYLKNKKNLSKYRIITMLLINLFFPP
jgi:hypothetical protein